MQRTLQAVALFVLLSGLNDIRPTNEQVVRKMRQESIKKVVLKNGMTILACRRGSAPKVLVQIAYNIGSAIEREGERGLAHLLEHMIFKGTAQLQEGDIDAIARKYGADFNAFTSYDMTSYYFETNKSNWHHFLPVFADCMQNARFDDQHIASELKTVIQELRMYKDSYWHVMVDHAFSSSFPSNHPYHHPIIGYKEDLADLSGERLHAFYNKYYAPSRAVLCIVGDIDLDEVGRLAEQAFDKIPPSGREYKPPFVRIPRELGKRYTTLYRDVQHERIGLFWRIPGLDAGVETLVSAVEYVLGGALNSRLYRKLVDELQIASQVRVGAEQLAVSGIVLMTIEPKEGKKQACIDAVVNEINALIQDGVSDDELYKMTKHRQREYVQMCSHLQSFAYSWIESFFAMQDEKNVFARGDEYEKITPQQVQAFVAEHLNPLYMQTIILAPLTPEMRGVWKQEQAREEEYFSYLLKKHQRTLPLGVPEYVYKMPMPTPLSFSFPKPTSDSVLNTSQLRVINYYDTKEQLVSAVLLFKDAAYFARSKEGVAVDLMMSMLIEQSKRFSKKEILEQFDCNGAQYSFSSRGVSITCMIDVFSQVFAHLMHVLIEPSFSQDAFEKLRAIMVHSFEQKKDSSRDQALRALRQRLYGDHPYNWSFEEMIAYLKGLSLDDIKKLHARIVRPSHMICSIAGGVAPDTVHDVVRKETTSWRPGEYVPSAYPVYAKRVAERIHIPLLRDQSILLYGRPSSVTIDDERYVPLDLLSTISFHSLGSRLFELRERTGLFYTATGCWAADVHQGHGFDYCMTILNPSNIAGADREICSLFDQIRSDGVGADELDAARQHYLKGLIDMTDNTGAIASFFANNAVLGLPDDYYDKSLQRVQQLSVEDVNQVARDYASSEGFIRVVVGRGEAS